MMKTALSSVSPAKYLASAAMHGGGKITGHVHGGVIMDTPAESCGDGERAQKSTKLLLNVNIQNSLGPVRVVLSPINTAGDLIKAAVEMYDKEKRRPLLPSTNPASYELHYSQFNLESLREEEKLINLESRNFFICPKSNNDAVMRTKCYIDAGETTNKSPFPLAKFMDFLL